MIKRLKKFLFTNTTNKQTVAKNTFWLSLSEAVGRILKLALIVYAARVLGAEGWGVFSYTLSFSSLLMIFSDTGISNIITRELVQKKENFKTFVSTALLLKSIILLISTAIVIFIGPSISTIAEAKILFPIMAIVLFFDSLRDLLVAINKASERMEREMTVKTIMNVVILITGFLLLTKKAAPMSVVIAYALGSIAGCITIFLMIKNELKTFFSTIDKRMFRVILTTTWPFAVIALIGIVMSNTDIVLLGMWKSPAEIGLYTSVQRIQQFALIVPTMLAAAVFPLFSRLAHTENSQFKNAIEKGLSLIASIGLPLAAFGIVLARPLILFLFGADYVGATPVLQLLMITMVVSFPLILLSNAFFALDKQKYLVMAYSFGAFSNIVLNILLIPFYGAIGAALAITIAQLLILVASWYLLQKISNFPIAPKILKIVGCTAIASIAILLMNNHGIHFIVSVIIATVVYVAALVLLKEPIVSDIISTITPKK